MTTYFGRCERCGGRDAQAMRAMELQVALCQACARDFDEQYLNHPLYLEIQREAAARGAAIQRGDEARARELTDAIMDIAPRAQAIAREWLAIKITREGGEAL